MCMDLRFVCALWSVFVPMLWPSFLPVLITQSPSSLTRTQELASSNSKSCSSSMRFAYSGSCFRLLFLFRASHSGRGLAVEAPAMVYTGTAEGLLSFIVEVNALCELPKGRRPAGKKSSSDDVGESATSPNSHSIAAPRHFLRWIISRSGSVAT